MRYAIWLPAGEIVLVRHYDAANNRAVIEHSDGRCETVAACKIRLLEYPAYLKTGLSS
jgi:hypothetical protein